MADPYAVAGAAILVVLAVVPVVLVLWAQFGPKPKPGHAALLRARLVSTSRDLEASRSREAALLRESEKLARQLARDAARLDSALNKLDEVAQRLRHCSCGIGQAVREELLRD
jgi:hypothetical protein